MIYFTSDCHFNHLNILNFEPNSRPFSNVKEMNETIIANWNNRVKPEDTVYVLGDFFMGRTEDIEPILDRLQGKIVLIRGNHDSKPRLEVFRSKGIEIKEIEYLNYKGKFFILNHFPNCSKEFAEMATGTNIDSIWLYGHIHSNAPKGYVNGSYHVGVDTNNLTPVSIAEVWEDCNFAQSEEQCVTCCFQSNCFLRQYGELEYPCKNYVGAIR